MSKRFTFVPLLLSILPIMLYWIIFFQFAYNVNYIAFDDTLILSILPAFEAATLYEKWKLLSNLFPEHRLVFSRSVVLSLYKIGGKVDLTHLMIVANLCYTACLYIFYKVFRSLNLSLWYFVPIAWIWLSIQAFENMFWGVSSLCNFGVLLFALSALYFGTYEADKPWKSFLFALLGTFTYGNGLFLFPILTLSFWLTGQRKLTLYTLFITAVVSFIYFIDFTPITQNLDLKNADQVRQGFFGFFGFIGSVATIAAYETRSLFLYIASFTGISITLCLVYIFRKQLFDLVKALFGKPLIIPKPLQFVLVLALFVFITALATTYKRIPTDTFEGMFKGRYRMYSILALLSVYIGFITVLQPISKRLFIRLALPCAILFWSLIAYFNIADIINNQRNAIAQEFNARYNADWLGLDMFSMDQAHFEKIRSYYQSEDPLASGWELLSKNASIHCNDGFITDTLFKTDDGNLYIKFKNTITNPTDYYANGHYVILKSDTHVYAVAPYHHKRPFKSFLSNFQYLNTELLGIIHTANIKPGEYHIYVLEVNNGQNKLHCTDKTWLEYE